MGTPVGFIRLRHLSAAANSFVACGQTNSWPRPAYWPARNSIGQARQNSTCLFESSPSRAQTEKVVFICCRHQQVAIGLSGKSSPSAIHFVRRREGVCSVVRAPSTGRRRHLCPRPVTARSSCLRHIDLQPASRRPPVVFKLIQIETFPRRTRRVSGHEKLTRELAEAKGKAKVESPKSWPERARVQKRSLMFAHLLLLQLFAFSRPARTLRATCLLSRNSQLTCCVSRRSTISLFLHHFSQQPTTRPNGNESTSVIPRFMSNFLSRVRPVALANTSGCWPASNLSDVIARDVPLCSPPQTPTTCQPSSGKQTTSCNSYSAERV